jgi:hypothetical protein
VEGNVKGVTRTSERHAVDAPAENTLHAGRRDGLARSYDARIGDTPHRAIRRLAGSQSRRKQHGKHSYADRMKVSYDAHQNSLRARLKVIFPESTDFAENALCLSPDAGNIHRIAFECKGLIPSS